MSFNFRSASLHSRPGFRRAVPSGHSVRHLAEVLAIDLPAFIVAAGAAPSRGFVTSLPDVASAGRLPNDL
jgi:hypothetical protein